MTVRVVQSHIPFQLSKHEYPKQCYSTVRSSCLKRRPCVKFAGLLGRPTPNPEVLHYKRDSPAADEQTEAGNTRQYSDTHITINQSGPAVSREMLTASIHISDFLTRSRACGTECSCTNGKQSRCTSTVRRTFAA